MDLSKKLEELKQLHSRIADLSDYYHYDELLTILEKTINNILRAEEMIDLMKIMPESEEVVIWKSARENLEIQLERLKNAMQNSPQFSLN